MRFELKNAKDVIDLIAKNADKHFDERINEQDNLDIDWDYAVQIARSNSAVAALMLNDDGAIVGYSIYEISSELFKKGKKLANSLAMYVHKDCRGKGTKELLRCVDSQLPKMGVHEVNYTFSNRQIAPFFKQNGFEEKHIVWGKDYV